MDDSLLLLYLRVVDCLPNRGDVPVVTFDSSITNVLTGKIVAMWLKGQIDQTRCFAHLQFIARHKEEIDSTLLDSLIRAATTIAFKDQLPPIDLTRQDYSASDGMNKLIGDLITYDTIISHLEKPRRDN